MLLTKLSVAVGLAGVALAANAVTYTPGTYTEKVNGHNAAFTVKVTVSKNKIEKIEYPDNLETIGVGKVALDKLSKKIIDRQSLGVDNVTGATITSFALKGAVKKALEQAKVSKADMAKLMKNSEKYTALPAEIKTNVVVVGKQGIEDSIQKHYEQTMKGGHNIGNPDLVHYLTDHALESVHWLESIGVKFKDEVGTATGALWQRSHYPATPSGNTYIRSFEKYIAAHGNDMKVYTDMDAVSLIQDKAGRVIGVVAKDNHTGKTTKFMADKGVILATGGFGANVALRQKVNTGVFKDYDLGKGIGCTNFNKSAQGSGIIMGEKVGAHVIGMSDIQVHPCGTPGTGLMEMVRTSGRNRLFINKEGNRFVNEGAPRDVLAKAIFAQPGSTYYVLVNHLRYPSLDWVDANGAKMKDMIDLGRVVSAPTLDELAKKLNMPAANLKKAVEDYNGVVAGTYKDPLGFVANNKADKQMTEGPWYACQKVPTVHHTMGGLEINTKAQVLDANGKVIPGLYAAGETTGGIHGSNRLGGNAIADIMTFGRDAGTHAAKGN